MSHPNMSIREWDEFFSSLRKDTAKALDELLRKAPRECWSDVLKQVRDVFFAWCDAIDHERTDSSGRDELRKTMQRIIGMAYQGFYSPEHDVWNTHCVRHQVKCLETQLRWVLQQEGQAYYGRDAREEERFRAVATLGISVREARHLQEFGELSARLEEFDAGQQSKESP